MGVGQTLSHTYPAIADSVPRARAALSTFARSAGATDDQLDSIRLAVSEAATNVVLHAYRDTPGNIQLDAELRSGELRVLVADDGSGMHPKPDSPGLGVGLSLISQVCDEFSIVDRSSGGIEVRMRFGLGGGNLQWAERPGGSIVHAAEPA